MTTERERWWKYPCRLVDDGTWAALWRPRGTTRGGGAASTVLLPLVLRSWPTSEAERWSKWAYVSRPRLADELAINRRTVYAGMAHLAELGLLQTRREPQPNRYGGHPESYRLAARLYAGTAEPFVPIGSWIGRVPDAASRHLLIVIAAKDAVRDDTAYVRAIAEDDAVDPQECGPFADEQRERHGMSVRALSEWSGLTRRTVHGALRNLIAVGALRHGLAVNGANWYSPRRPKRSVTERYYALRAGGAIDAQGGCNGCTD